MRAIVLAATGTDERDFARACTLAPEVTVLRVPALAERRDDLLPLVTATIDLATRKHRFGKAVDITRDVPGLLAYHWPGNLKELKEGVERVVAVRAAGTLRAASAAINVSKSAIADTFKKLALKS